MYICKRILVTWPDQDQHVKPHSFLGISNNLRMSTKNTVSLKVQCQTIETSPAFYSKDFISTYYKRKNRRPRLNFQESWFFYQDWESCRHLRKSSSREATDHRSTWTLPPPREGFSDSGSCWPQKQSCLSSVHTSKMMTWGVASLLLNSFQTHLHRAYLMGRT